MVARRPIDSLAIVTASVTSIAIIINAAASTASTAIPPGDDLRFGTFWVLSIENMK